MAGDVPAGQGLLAAVVVVEPVDPGVVVDEEVVVLGCELVVEDIPCVVELEDVPGEVLLGVVVGTQGLLPAGVVGEAAPGTCVPVVDEGVVVDGKVDGVVWGVGVAVCGTGVAV